MPTKRKSLAQRARDLHAAEPGLTPAQIAARLDTYRQRVESALKGTGAKTGPKPRAKCEHCGGTGYAPELPPTSVVIAGRRYVIDSEAGERRAFAALAKAGLSEVPIMSGDRATGGVLRAVERWDDDPAMRV